MAPVLEASACEDDGEVGVGVGAGVAHAAAEDYGGIVQQGGAPDVLHGRKFFEEAIELGHQGRFDDVQLAELLGVLARVREVVVAAIDARDVRHRQGAADVQRDDARGVGLEGERGDVEIRPDLVHAAVAA